MMHHTTHPAQSTMMLKPRQRGDRIVKLPGQTSPDRLSKPEVVSEIIDRMLISQRWQDYQRKKPEYVKTCLMPQVEALGQYCGGDRLMDWIIERSEQFMRGEVAPIKAQKFEASARPVKHRATFWKFFLEFARDIGAITDIKAENLYRACGYKHRLKKPQPHTLTPVVSADTQDISADAQIGVDRSFRPKLMMAQLKAMRNQIDAMIAQLDAMGSDG